jgi:hypothetical protein
VENEESWHCLGLLGSDFIISCLPLFGLDSEPNRQRLDMAVEKNM